MLGEVWASQGRGPARGVWKPTKECAGADGDASSRERPAVLR